MKKTVLLKASLLSLFIVTSCNSDNESQEPIKVQQNHELIKGNNVAYDKVYKIVDGIEYDITKEQYESTKIKLPFEKGIRSTGATYDFYSITPLATVNTYLGAIYDGNDFENGIYNPVGEVFERLQKTTMSLSVPVLPVEINTTYSGQWTGIVKSLRDEGFSGEQSVSFTYSFKQISKYKELQLAFGANVNVGTLFSVDIDINSTNLNYNTVMYVDFNQVYFNAVMDYPGNIFIDNTVRDKYASKNPIYINSVDYGRRGVIMAQSNYSYQEVSAAFRAAFTAKVVDGSVSLDVNSKKILSESKITICIIGGHKDAPKVAANLSALNDFLVEGGEFTKTKFGVPISFTAAYAKDNRSYVSKLKL
ncbi:thiol-activated cytolysin family protein [Myroides sp. N17-2]|uniref:thiol-activated cytolysin family protein n=1 Tax=Myroides sp. N17-2 TaxID=2030799 RepID=UPI000EFB087D|nr:thiol-activated cytolysin family protein [Myroides sp. N17-2]